MKTKRKSLKKIGLYFWKKIDGLVIDRFGPDGISKVIKFTYDISELNANPCGVPFICLKVLLLVPVYSF